MLRQIRLHRCTGVSGLGKRWFFTRCRWESQQTANYDLLQIDLVEESNRNSLLGRQANDENLAMIREKFDVFVKAYKNDVRDLRDKEAANSLALTELRNALENVRIRAKASGSVSQDEVSRIVALQLSRYDADKTGLPDFALENSGWCRSIFRGMNDIFCRRGRGCVRALH